MDVQTLGGKNICIRNIDEARGELMFLAYSFLYVSYGIFQASIMPKISLHNRSWILLMRTLEVRLCSKQFNIKDWYIPLMNEVKILKVNYIVFKGIFLQVLSV